jgi:predicted HTH domain antitoxin
MTVTLALELPGRLSSTAERTAREGAIIALWQTGELSTGRAAESLGVSYRRFLEMLAERNIPVVQADEPNYAAMDRYRRQRAKVQEVSP